MHIMHPAKGLHSLMFLESNYIHYFSSVQSAVFCAHAACQNKFYSKRFSAINRAIPYNVSDEICVQIFKINQRKIFQIITFLVVLIQFRQLYDVRNSK